MTTVTFINALAWGSLFLLTWQLLLGELPLTFGTGLAWAFFLIIGVLVNVPDVKEGDRGKSKTKR